MNPDHIENIKAALAENSFCILENFAAPADLPNWSDAINSLNASAHKQADFHINDPFIETQINFAIRRGIGYFYSFFDNKDVYVQPKLEPIVKELQDNDLNFFGNSIFINLFTEDDFARPHSDDWSNNLYIQCEGQTTWMLYEKKDSPEPSETHILSPGDAIFFTGDIIHSITADTPRASIVLRMDRKAL